MSTLATTDDREVVRPLRVIEAELKELFRQAAEAAEEAKLPYYKKIGPLLSEAKESHFQRNSMGFLAWTKEKFGISQTTTYTCLRYEARDRSKSFESQEDFLRTPKNKGGAGWSRPAPGSRMSREWTGPVDEVAQRARKEALRIAQEDVLSRAQEREAYKKLAVRLIDIGYKVLAKELHPDKMDGDKTAFQRLARIRDNLKHSLGV
jgi:hypothetical protein